MAIVNSAAVNIQVQVSLWIRVGFFFFFFLDMCPGEKARVLKKQSKYQKQPSDRGGMFE